MIDPRPYIRLVEAFNAIEHDVIVSQLAEGDITRGVQMPGQTHGICLDFGGAYSIEWDSIAERWTLVSETDDAPELCPFNKQQSECGEGRPCRDCSVAQAVRMQEAC